MSGHLNFLYRAINTKLSVFVILTASLALMCLPAYAMSKSDAKAVNQISRYLSKASSLTGNFTQIAPGGQVSTGKFYIAKPGKMRFEYAPPNPFIIISDGKWVTVKNKTKKRAADQYPLSATPLKMVLAKKVDLLKKADILDVNQNDGMATVTLRDKDQFVSGELVLVFDQQQNRLQQWIVVDGQGRRTTVSISQVKQGVKIDPKLFFYDNRRQRQSGSDR